MNRKNPSAPEPTESEKIEVDRSKLLGFDQTTEDCEPGRLGPHLGAKIGPKPGFK